MAGITEYLANKWLDHVLKTQAYTPPSGLFLGLGEVVGGVWQSEISDPYYRRQPISFLPAQSDTGVAQILPYSDLERPVRFPIARQSWGDITQYGVFDAVTGGNLLFSSDYPISSTVNAGDVVEVAAGTGVSLANILNGNAGPSFSNWLGKKLLNLTLRGEAFSMSGVDINVVLCDVEPQWDDTGSTISQISGGGYPEDGVSHNSWDAAGGKAAFNDGEIRYPEVTDADPWDGAQHFALVDSSGNLLIFGYCTMSSPQVGEEVVFYDGNLAITLDDV
jgi:hypothetical protein